MVLTREEVLQVLRNKLGEKTEFDLKCFETKKVQVHGTMGEFFKLSCTIILKTNTAGNEIVHKFFVKRKSPLAFDETTVKVFQKECETYRMFLKMDSELLNRVIARCYLVNENNLVFSDLCDEGYVQQEARKEPTIEEVKLLLKTLARLHASTIIYEERKSRQLGRPYSMLEDHKEALDEYYCRESGPGDKYVQSMVNCLKRQADVYRMPENLDNGKNFKKEMDKLVNILAYVRMPSTRFRNVICHNDLWAANLFVMLDEKNGSGRRPPVHMRLIDFQITRYKPPAQDVMSALYLHTTRVFRSKHQRDLLEIYYKYFRDYLARSGIDAEQVYTREQFLKSCQEGRLMATYNECNTMQLVLLSQEDLSDLLKSEDMMRFYMEDRSLLLDKYKKNAFYDLRCKDALLDLKDVLEEGLLDHFT